MPVLGPSNPRPTLEALRGVLSLISAADIRLDNDALNVFTGTWVRNTGAGQFAAASALNESFTVNDVWSRTAPADWATDGDAGKVLAFHAIVQKADSLVLTLKKNGATVRDITVDGSLICDPGATANAAYTPLTVRIGPGADGQTIAASSRSRSRRSRPGSCART